MLEPLEAFAMRRSAVQASAARTVSTSATLSKGADRVPHLCPDLPELSHWSDVDRRKPGKSRGFAARASWSQFWSHSPAFIAVRALKLGQPPTTSGALLTRHELGFAVRESVCGGDSTVGSNHTATASSRRHSCRSATCAGAAEAVSRTVLVTDWSRALIGFAFR